MLFTRKHLALAITPLLLQPLTTVMAQPTAMPIEELEVSGRKLNLIGFASSASEGVVSQDEIAIRPLLRVGEILETVPGLVATQHSGPGKANQYFLRGFNLDHGTDFATSVDAMPVNMRSHGHGQGYTDLNFIIPELVGEVHYQKGSYYPGTGDFSGAGRAQLQVSDRLDGHRIRVGSDFGQENWNRALAWGQVDTSERSSLIYGAELEVTDGHWDDIRSDMERKNLWLKPQWQDGDNRYALTFMAYDNSWNSADQIPQRAVDQDLITEFGSIDTSTGGESSRYSLSGNWQRNTNRGQLDASAYAIQYNMDLWGNLTYFTEPEGDQHHQVDDRMTYGWDIAWTQEDNWGGLRAMNTFGSQMRYDDISKVGLYDSQERVTTDVIRLDTVEQWSKGLYWENELHWTERLRTTAGLRYDHYDFRVKGRDSAFAPAAALNSGSTSDDIITASAGISYAFSDEIEAYANIGQGFHSNDARGVMIGVDPSTGEAVEAADPLVDTRGMELGLRTFLNEQLNASIALWGLEIDSELLFEGDEGTTDDTGAGSRRHGIEVAAYYYLDEQWTFDVEYAWSHARFREALDDSREIPGALEHVVSAGANLQLNDRFQAHLRLRHFEDYPLDEGLRADASTIANLRLSYRINEAFELSMDVLNLLDSRDRDIEYAYESRLRSEMEQGLPPVVDRHFHVFEPRTFKFNLQYRF